MSEIKPGQVYRSADPGESISLRVLYYRHGDTHVRVTDTNVKRPRQIKVASLHTDPLTRSGEPRRTGYVLVQDA